jgi:hypothetical protein
MTFSKIFPALKDRKRLYEFPLGITVDAKISELPTAIFLVYIESHM